MGEEAPAQPVEGELRGLSLQGGHTSKLRFQEQVPLQLKLLTQGG